jgi:hypothetical protein
VAKIVSKGIFKAAGKALSKVAISKVAGTAGGAAIGAAIGSVVPGAGTIVGGVIGGALAGVFVDKVLLELEEAISREDFRMEILNSIRESRDEFKSESIWCKVVHDVRNLVSSRMQAPQPIKEIDDGRNNIHMESGAVIWIHSTGR